MEAFIQALRLLPISGCSVTIPHKRRVVPLCDGLSEWAARTGAVNTLYWNKEKLFGENTDCPGFMAPLQEQGMCPASALVLGTGGAALACIAGLQALGVQEIWVAGRNPGHLQVLQEYYSINPVGWEDRAEIRAAMLVNTTPLGMAGQWEAASPYPGKHLGRFRCVYDLVYNPLWTHLLSEAREAGCTCISGLDMFVGQAAGQFLLWTGRHMPAALAKQWVHQELLNHNPKL